MKKLLFTLLFLFAIPVQAGEYAVFRGGSHTNIDLCLTDNPPVNSTDVWIPFIPTNGDRVIQHYDYDINNNLVYWTPPTPPPIINRDLKGFVMAVRTEPTFNAQIRNNLGKIFGLVAADYQTPALAQQDWGDAVANPDNSGWLTQAVQDKVVQFATTYKIPITAAIK